MNDFAIDQDRNLYRDRLYSKAINDEEASLTHYGVLGMRWGHRKAKDTGGNGKSRKGKNSKNSTKSKAENTRNALKTAGKVALGVAGVAGAALAGKAIYDNRDDIMNMGSSVLNSIHGFRMGLSGGASYGNENLESASAAGRAVRAKVASGASGVSNAVSAVGSAAKQAGSAISGFASDVIEKAGPVISDTVHSGRGTAGTSRARH